MKGAALSSSVNQQRHPRASEHDDTSALVAGPLDEALRTMYRSTGSVSQAVNTFAAFPPSITSPADAKITELSASFTAVGRVHIVVSFRTTQSMDELSTLYHQTLTDAGVVIGDSTSPAPQLTVSRGKLDNGASGDTTTHLSAEDYGETRRVRIAVSYDDVDPTATFATHADWHRRAAPVDDAKVGRFELTTAQNRYSPTFSTLYTTTYRLPDCTVASVRPQVELRLKNAGWTWFEPKAGVLFLTGPFDAETHIYQEGQDTFIDFVGDFEVANT